MGLLKRVAIGWLCAIIIRPFTDDVARFAINYMWENRKEVQLTGDETEEEAYKVRKASLEGNRLYMLVHYSDLLIKYLTGDKQEFINGLWLLDWHYSQIEDRFDFVEDKTGYNPKTNSGDKGYTIEISDIVAIERGEIEKLNLKINYGVSETLTRTYSENDIVDPNATRANMATMRQEVGNTKSKHIYIKQTYPVYILYSNDQDKIEIATEESEDGKTIMNIKVYQDSFEGIPKIAGNTIVDKGRLFKGDPLTTVEEFEQVAREAAKRGATTRGGDDRTEYENYLDRYEKAKYNNTSPNAMSYFWSDKFLNDHPDKFLNTENEILTANAKQYAQETFAFFVWDLYNNKPDNVEFNIEVADCNFADKKENTNYEPVVWSNIEFPDDVSKALNIKDNLPSVGGKAEGLQYTTVTETQLNSMTKKVYGPEEVLELPKQDEQCYRVIDYGSIEKVKEPEAEIEGRNTIEKKNVYLSKTQQVGNYYAPKCIPDDFDISGFVVDNEEKLKKYPIKKEEERSIG